MLRTRMNVLRGVGSLGSANTGRTESAFGANLYGGRVLRPSTLRDGHGPI